ncbi:hypothetical protein, partial [Methanocalculus sp.]|uniref:hypothetical protein n=1 Tax=Methanocalculus sp. TaxID=2004547 RepID=UPI00260AF967
MSNLYYANLGEKDPDQFEERVIQRLRDFQGFLENAEYRMRKKRYKFSFSVKQSRGRIITENKNVKIDFNSPDGFFF